jgi:diguanylate cyclase (GGDEF)-like protein/PAS domain S-box-containing protein
MGEVSFRLLLVSQEIVSNHNNFGLLSLIGMPVFSDSLMAIAYYSLTWLSIYLLRYKQDLPARNLIIVFATFALACGTTQIVNIWNTQYSVSELSEILRAIAAIIALCMVGILIFSLPEIINLPSIAQLEATNQNLSQRLAEIEEKERKTSQLNTELELRAKKRAVALKLAYESLEKTKKFKEKITDLVPSIIYIYDLQAERYTYVNRYINEILGYSPQEIIDLKSQMFDELIDSSDIEAIKYHYQYCLDLKEDEYVEITYRIQDRQGRWHWLHSKDTVFEKDDCGQPTQVLGIAYDVTASKEAQLKTEELNKRLATEVKALEIRNQERINLGEMNGFLQACLSLKEAKNALPDLLQPLFPNTDGAVYLLSNSKDLLEAIATWGDISSSEHFLPQECWALRRSSPYKGEPTAPRIYCNHLKQNLTPTLCLPMMAQGETMGLLYLRLNNSISVSQEFQELGQSVAQNIAMAFASLQLQETLRYQSLRDPLTGLFNRRFLEESLAREIDRAKRKQQFIGIIMIDVDHFKRFNDTYGHEAGDLVLQTVGNYLKKQIRQYDVACRYGGEELVIIMPDASLDNTILRAEEIRKGIKKLHIEHDGKQLEPITISVGVSCFPDDAIEVQSLIRAADKALYEAKAQGRDRVLRC